MGAAAIAGDHRIRERRRNAMRRFQLFRKNLRDMSDPFALDVEYFRQHYRLTQPLALQLIDILRDTIVQERVSAIPVHLQVLATLRFLAEGSLQKGVANDLNHPVSQSSMSRCIDRVLNSIVDISNQYISFPECREERQRIKNGFRRFNRIPHIIGLIDCFKVTFFRPPENEESFYNYSVGTSMNVQVIANSDYIIQNICVCPGANTDQFIWRFSEIKDFLEQLRMNDNVIEEEGRYYLLGDNGYTLSPILLTPIIDAPPNSPEADYTSEFVSTRCKIEQTFGILTNVWRAIHRSRKLYYKPEKVAKIIIASATLHNFRLMHGMINEDDYAYLDDAREQQEPYNEQANNLNYAEGLIERNNIVRLHYT